MDRPELRVALDVILLGYARKIVKLATEQASSRRVTPSIRLVERHDETFQRTKKLIQALFNEEEINKGEREAYDFGWRTGFKQGGKQEREGIFNLMKENGQLSAMQIINGELFIPQTLREK